MAELVWQLIAIITGAALIWITIKSERSRARKTTTDHALIALIETLQMAIDADEIDTRVASLLVANWTHMFSNRDSDQKCACGNVHLHCERDRTTLEGITHTAKYCDTEVHDDDRV
jgi:ABC-type nickel/cobalt efflux system permease component RcnA